MEKAQVHFTKILKSLAIVSLAFVAVSSFLFIYSQKVNAAAGINRTINFQGKLVNNPAKTNVTDTTYTVVFKIYDVASGGTALWTETQTVTTADGIFRVALGSVTPFPADFNWNWDGRYLGIKVNSDSEMTPRVQLAAVPYAFNAEKVSGLTVQDSTSGASSTSAILKLGDATTQKTFDLGANNLTFSTSGTTTLTLPTSGTVTALGNTTTGSGSTLVLNSNPSLAGLTLSSGAITLGGVTGSGQCITGGATAAWGSCGSGVNWWNQLGGVLSPASTTYDFALGATSTASALFSFTGIQNASHQTIASASGRLIVMPNNGYGNVGINTATPVYPLDVAGDTNLSTGSVYRINGTSVLSGTALGGNVTSSSLTSVGTLTSLTMGGTLAMGANNLTSSATIGTAATTTFTGAGATFTGLTVNFGSDATGDILYRSVGGGLTRLAVGTSSQCLIGGTTPAWNSCFSAANNLWTTGTDGKEITAINQTLDLTYGGTSSTSAIFAVKGLTDLNHQTVATHSGRLIVMPNNGYGNVGINTATPVYPLDVAGDTNLSTGSVYRINGTSVLSGTALGGNVTSSSLTSVGTLTSLTMGGTLAMGANNLTSSATIGTASTTTFTGAGATFSSAIAANGGITFDNTSDTLGSHTLGGGVLGNSQSITALSGLTINGGGTLDSATSGTFAIASTTNTTSLTIGNSGMTSGMTFNIDTAANYTFQKEGSAFSCSGTDKLTLTTGNLTCSTDVSGGAGGGSNWTLSTANGTLSPNNNTLDLLFGGTATTSAKFAVLGVNNTRGTQVASISGSLFLDSSTANVQSTLFQTLTLGGDKTGNIIIAPWNGAASSTLQIKAANTYLGINGSMNGSISFYSSGASITPPTISTDSSGNLNLSATQAGASVVVGSGVGDIVIDPGTYKVGVGISSSVISQLHVTRALTNGATGKALAIFDQIENQDIFTASKSGVVKFIIGKNGEIGLGLSAGIQNFGNSGQCLQSAGTGTIAAWGACDGTTNWWTTSSDGKAITPINSTMDLLLGNTATSSAVYAFGVSSAYPVATFSADLILGQRPNSPAASVQNWTKITGTAGTIGGNNSSIASISAAAVFNGSLYVGTNKNTGAEVYRYNSNNQTWSSVSGTAGTIGGNSTTGIDMVSSMTVYNGFLYVGTFENARAEVYRYDGGTSWTKLNSTPGTFQTTAAINGVTAMGVWNGKLYIGTSKPAAAELYRYDGGTSWTVINTTAGTFVTTNTASTNMVTSIVGWNGSLYLGVTKATDGDVIRYNGSTGASVFTQMNGGTTTATYTFDGGTATSMENPTLSVYEGRLIVGLQKANGAEVMMWQPNSAFTTTDYWQRLANTGGTIKTGGTASIDAVSALAVYNGVLYAGTSESNDAEIYKYEGNKGDWTLVSQAVNGAIASGGTSSIDQISVLINYNHNSLFAGTQEGTSAEGYSYVYINDQSYALKFDAGTAQAGGEQNNLQNLASIFFVASLSANVNNDAANTGTFVFSHGIMTSHGAYDVAEDYPTRDDTLQQGDVVSIDTNERGFVVKSNGAYDSTAIGVYSENPGLRLSQNEDTINGGKAVPIALAGRVPVKVTSKNGVIKSGDPLTASDIPGVAMKATKNGLIIGEAMEGFDGDGVGKVMAYIKSTSYDGSIADSFTGIDTNSQTFGQDILGSLKDQPQAGTSDMVTDRLVASIEVVSPKITVDELFAKRIVAGQIDGLDLISNRLANLETKVASLSASLQPTPQASDSSLLVKQNELIDRITKDLDQKASASSQFANLSLGSLESSGLTIIPGGIRVKGNGLFEGILTILDTLTTNNFIVNGTSTFFQDIVAKAKVTFEGPVTFSNDAGGFATIVKGTDRISVVFDQGFEQNPLVNTSISFDEKKDEQGNIINSTSLEQAYFKAGYRYIIVNKSNKGFTIVLNKKAADDLNFTWTAIRVKDAKTIQSRLPD